MNFIYESKITHRADFNMSATEYKPMAVDHEQHMREQTMTVS